MSGKVSYCLQQPRSSVFTVCRKELLVYDKRLHSLQRWSYLYSGMTFRYITDTFTIMCIYNELRFKYLQGFLSYTIELQGRISVQFLMRFNSLNLLNHLLQLLLTYCKGSQYLDFPSAYNAGDTFPPPAKVWSSAVELQLSRMNRENIDPCATH